MSFHNAPHGYQQHDQAKHTEGYFFAGPNDFAEAMHKKIPRPEGSSLTETLTLPATTYIDSLGLIYTRACKIFSGFSDVSSFADVKVSLDTYDNVLYHTLGKKRKGNVLGLFFPSTVEISAWQMIC